MFCLLFNSFLWYFVTLCVFDKIFSQCLDLHVDLYSIVVVVPSQCIEMKCKDRILIDAIFLSIILLLTLVCVHCSTHEVSTVHSVKDNLYNTRAKSLENANHQNFLGNMCLLKCWLRNCIAVNVIICYNVVFFVAELHYIDRVSIHLSLYFMNFRI